MNRWTARHHRTLADALDPGESLLAAARVMITAAVVDETARADRGSRSKRAEAARELGFPVPGPIFVVALTDSRVLLVRASTWLGRPRELSGGIPLADVATVRAVRRLLAERLAIVLEDRSMLVVQPLWSRGLRDLDRAFAAATG